MKKIISMILTLSMVLSLAAAIGLTISAAPEGTAINSAADFAGMAADGKYYLAADITIEATYETQFTGTFDGNGKTVTVKVPMFKDFSGTIKNLNVAGEVTTGYAAVKTTDAAPTIYPFDDAAAGAVAAYAIAPEGKTVVFENITSGATVNVPAVGETNSAAGALYGVGNGNITISKCTNNGEITGKDQVGGLVGWADRSNSTTFTAIDCVNNGTVNMAGNYGGGIAGRGSEGTNVFTNCTNNGALNCYKSQFGGMVGYLEHKGNVTITGCVNNGVPSDINNEDTQFPNFGGMIGVSSTKAENLTVTVENCINTVGYNPVAPKEMFAGGMAARIRSNSNAGATIIIKNCLNTGDFSNCGTVGGIVGQLQAADKKLANVTVADCLNTGNITGGTTATSGTCRIGGVLGHTEWVSLDIDNCVNNGNISDSESISGVDPMMGGILAYLGGKNSLVDGTVNTITNCVNNGAVSSTKSPKNGDVGGIAGLVLQSVTFNNCVNNGIITCNNDRAAGILASGGTSNKVLVVTYNYCINNGAINGKQVGGISAYQYGSENEEFTAYAVANGCINTAPITSAKGSYAAGMIAYYNAINTTYKNCFNSGAIVSTGDESGHKANILGWNNKQAHKPENITGNIYVEGTGAQLFCDNAGYTAETDPKPAYTAAAADNAAFAKSGTATEAIAAINAAAGSEVFKADGDKATAPCAHNFPASETYEAIAPTCTAAGKAAGYKCSACEAVVGCEEVPAIAHTYADGKCTACGAADPNAAPIDPPATGDNAWIYMIVAAVAIIGSAVVLKKREN